MSEKPDVPSVMDIIEQLAAPRSLTGGWEIILADWERRIRAETLAPFHNLVEWDSEENLEDDHAERWIKLGDKLRALLPPKEAHDD